MTGRPRNPYIGLLWLASVGLIAVGASGYAIAIWLSWGGSLDYPPSGGVMLWANFAQGVGSGIVLVGLGALIALPFFLRWLRTRERVGVTRATSR